MALLIPSIDLMGGKVVQLVQGRKKAFESADLDHWIERFSRYPTVQVIDLDAALGSGDNRALISDIVRRLPAQVGGGIRSLDGARAMIQQGARRVILGSALVRGGAVNRDFAASLAEALDPDRLVFAVDAHQNRVAIAGWRERTRIDPLRMVEELEPWCGGFLFTNIATEGRMRGLPLSAVRRLRNATNRRLAVAGGIRSEEEVEELDRMRVDAVVGMAIYTGKMRA